MSSKQPYEASIMFKVNLRSHLVHRYRQFISRRKYISNRREMRFELIRDWSSNTRVVTSWLF